MPTGPRIVPYPEVPFGTLEQHTRWEPSGGTGVYRRSLFMWRNFSGRWTPCDLMIFLDGQNLFAEPKVSRQPHWSGESRFSKWPHPLLVVGVPASKKRYQEYVGWSQEPGHYSPSGHRHAVFLAEYVIPYIRSCFPRARLKGLVGASAGGVAALYTGWSYPKLFPSVACLSAGRHYFSELLQAFPGTPAKRIYLSCGDSGMDREFLDDNKDFASALKKRCPERLLCRWHRGDHSEPVWSRRIPGLLTFALQRPL